MGRALWKDRDDPSPSGSASATHEAESSVSEETCTSGPLLTTEDDVSHISSIEDKLNELKLQTRDPFWLKALDKAQQALSDVIKTPLSVCEKGCETPLDEAKMWCCFADVYGKELKELKRSNSPLGEYDKTQVLADILVWAEITAPGYDRSAASFIIKPHQADGSFQRIGKLLAESKIAAGIPHQDSFPVPLCHG